MCISAGSAYVLLSKSGLDVIDHASNTDIAQQAHCRAATEHDKHLACFIEPQ